MKTLFTTLGIISVANLLAIIGFVGFLAGTDRLNRARIDEVRGILAPTITEVAQLEEEENADSEADTDEPDVDVANEGVESRNKLIRTTEEILREKNIRAQQDLENMKRYVDRRLQDIESAQTKLDEERQEFDAEVKRVQALRADEQFQKVVNTFKGIGAEQQKALLDQYLAQGKDELALDILDALDKRTMQKLFKTYDAGPDVATATDLLERLKNRP